MPAGSGGRSPRTRSRRSRSAAERISYEELLLLADGLDCDPSDLIAEGEMSSQRRADDYH